MESKKRYYVLMLVGEGGKSMKKVVLLASTLFLLVLLTGCEASCEFGDVPNDEGTIGEELPDAQEEQVEPSREDAEYGEMINFADDNLGFAIDYPSDWFDDVGDTMVVFSDNEGSSVVIQNLIHGGDMGYPDIESVYEGMKLQFEEFGGSVSLFEEGVFELNGEEFSMLKFDAEYEFEGTELKEMVKVIERNEEIFHQFTYTAPVDLYNHNLNIAESMLDTFSIQ